MYFKIIKDGYIVDAIMESELQYVKMNRITNLPVACEHDDEDVFGILASDYSVVYAINPTDGYDLVEMRNVESEEEYRHIIDEISSQRFIEYEEGETQDVNISVLKTVIAQNQTAEIMSLMSKIVDDLSDEDIIKYPNLVEAWQSGQSYDEGKRISYEGVIYKVTKSIKTSSATPDNSPNYQTL